jgi:hypothetical protein
LPLSAVPPDLVIDYLSQPGIGRGYSRDEARWKYYDHEFNAGRERGFASLKDGRVRGFIGMIPVTVSTPDAGDRPLVWTCDWSVADQLANPGIGVLLLTAVHRGYDFVGGVGGTEDTRSIVPRMNTRTVADATVVLRRPLRLRPLLERVEKAVPFAPRLSSTALAGIPVPVRRRRAGSAASVTSGVSASVAALFDAPSDGACSVRYDARHLAWLGRSPVMHVQSAHLTLDGMEAGAVFWRRQVHPTRWRLALRAGPGGEALLEPLLAEILSHLRDREGASLLSVAVSGNDAALLATLKRHAFVTGERHDLYITRLEGPGSCGHGFSPMSYLDTDLGLVPWAEELI